MARIADLTFGLDRIALPLLSLLSTMDPDFADFEEGPQMYDVLIQTHTYFSGDRRWAALVMFPNLAPDGLRYVVTFGRDPYDDVIVVESWGPCQAFEVGESPTASDVPENCRGRRFGPTELIPAVSFIRAELAMAYRTMRASRAMATELVSDG